MNGLKCRRRGIHALISVAMLIGFTIIVAGVLLAILAEYGAISTNHTECALSNVSMYEVGDRAYLVMSLYNLGSGTMTAASVTFVDDDGMEHGFYGTSLEISSGGVWSKMGLFSASISDRTYVVRATTIADDGSVTTCFASV